jgi:hypothetical protein
MRLFLKAATRLLRNDMSSSLPLADIASNFSQAFVWRSSAFKRREKNVLAFCLFIVNFDEKNDLLLALQEAFPFLLGERNLNVFNEFVS